jgi:hypothetical protein
MIVMDVLTNRSYDRMTRRRTRDIDRGGLEMIHACMIFIFACDSLYWIWIRRFLFLESLTICVWNVTTLYVPNMRMSAGFKICQLLETLAEKW